MSQTLHFAIEPARLERLRATLADKGLALTGDTGKIQKMHADVDYAYVDGELTLTINSAPWLNSMEGFAQRLTDFVTNQA